MLVDLDNTLLDRRAAFNTWASAFIGEMNGSAADLAWLLAEDADGYRPRAALARAIVHRFHLASSWEQLVDRLLREHVELIQPFPGVPSRLEALAADGACIVVVTNGPVSQQTTKLVQTGLLQLVDQVVISEAVGVKKLDRRIFEAAVDSAIRTGGTGPIWMIGDHRVADIAGARNCGLATGWVSRGDEWTADWSPTISARCSVDVLDLYCRPHLVALDPALALSTEVGPSRAAQAVPTTFIRFIWSCPRWWVDSN